MSRVTLLGIPWDLADELSLVLRDESHAVTISDGPIEFEPDVVFISGDSPDLAQRMAALRGEQPHLPVVVVTRLPDTGRWLDALEAGARDYCGAPFEHVQIRWIMETIGT